MLLYLCMLDIKQIYNPEDVYYINLMITNGVFIITRLMIVVKYRELKVIFV